ncbi:MAG: sugar phosphate isomerase/epimerase [Phycisphaerae bacterium]|nr:sugar phosphate isomerase/epimerase [Phycisphaerae bacterium]
MAKVTSISSLGWAHYTLYEALPRMAARGFTRVEIASFSSYCFHFNFGSPTPLELKKMLDDLGLAPVALNYSIGVTRAWVPQDAERFVSETSRKIEQLPQVGIPMVTMNFSNRNDRDDQEMQLTNMVKAYDRVAEIAKTHGVRMLLEVPHLYDVAYGPEQVYWIFDHINSDNIGALADCSHWGIIGYDVDEFFSRLGERLWHVHLRDSRGPDTGDRMQDLELTPGAGTVDFGRFGRAMDAAGYKGDVSLEFEYRDMTLDDIEREYDVGIKHLVACGWEFPSSVLEKMPDAAT